MKHKELKKNTKKLILKTQQRLKSTRHPNIDKIYLYAQDPFESKYLFLINKEPSTGLKHLNSSKTFIKYSNDMDDVCTNIIKFNPNK